MIKRNIHLISFISIFIFGFGTLYYHLEIKSKPICYYLVRVTFTNGQTEIVTISSEKPRNEPHLHNGNLCINNTDYYSYVRHIEVLNEQCNDYE